MSLCLLLQSTLLMTVVGYYRKHRDMVDSPSIIESLIVVNVVLSLLVVGNLGQVAIWALVFQLLGEFERFADAYYHSAVNFATLGYGDVVMSERYRLLGAIEAINGVLMIGISTAALISAYQDSMRKTLAARERG
jgi:hypothetical protein